jgi:hypothetical protein
LPCAQAVLADLRTFKVAFVFTSGSAIALRDITQLDLDYSVLARIATACVGWLVAAIKLVHRAVTNVFFWLIDIIPLKSDNVEEAKEIVIAGPPASLGKRLMRVTTGRTQILIKSPRWPIGG